MEVPPTASGEGEGDAVPEAKDVRKESTREEEETPTSEVSVASTEDTTGGVLVEGIEKAQVKWLCSVSTLDCVLVVFISVCVFALRMMVKCRE